MATTRSFSSTYAGKAAAGYLLPAIAGGETLSTAGIQVHTDVKFKEVLKKFSSANIIQSGATSGCDLYNASGTLTISEAVLEPKPFKINSDICFADVYKLWDQPSPAGMNNEELSAELEEAIITNFAEKSAEFFDQLAWQGGVSGATGNLTLVDGFSEQLKDASSVITGVTLTSANVVTEMNKLINALPAAVKKRKENLVLFVSYKTAFLYEQNLAAQGLQTTAQGQTPSIYGIEVRAVGGMLDNIMVLGERSNFHVGTDLESDWSEVTLIDKRYTTGDEVISFKMKYKVDFKVAFPTEAVLYGSNNLVIA